MKTKHTSGPWLVEEEIFIYAADPHIQIATVHTPHDARLMAAAPELLAYLENVLTFEGKTLGTLACNSIRMLIAEAKGK